MRDVCHARVVGVRIAAHLSFADAAEEMAYAANALDRDDLRVTAAGMKAQARDHGDGFAGLSELCMSASTASNHVAAIKQKLGVSCVSDIVRYAARVGLV